MSVSLCVLRIEIDEDLPEMANNLAEVEHAQEQKKKDRGARESKTITVETYASVVSGRSSGTGILPTSSRRSPPEASNDRETISFFCGNPLVEVTKGVLHLYKENELKETEEAKTLCLLSVPGALGAADLLAFAAACQQDICHVRVLRDGSPDHYMALFTFRTYDAAREFHTAFSGVPYSSLEPQALCHVAWVSRVEYARSGTPPPAHTELPTCPVCLERMDESVAGVLSVQCSHSFHADCLVRWSDARCPVCRCAQTPEPRERAVCLQCEIEGGPIEEGGPMGEGEGAGEALESYGSLWICLICGHVGCGRYEKGHAAKHFLASNHTYALQLGSNRVWDYAVQNKADGKLVAAEGGVGSDAGCHEKLDSAQLEFTYILTHQLDSQRAYYEEKINRLEIEHRATTAAGVRRAETAESEVSELRLKLSILTREHVAVERRMQSLANKVTTLQTELQEERGLASALASSHKQWQEQARKTEEALTKEVSELKEELRDVMFFVEARTSLAAAAPAEELAEATVTVAPAKPRRKRR
ncbi:BRCA1-associated protein isoform X2 [Danaus plexippus]|uniref:BRCA1-associated protein isoform X2 n=1 Tax=Danaus plexippus TaxID=13037 RepID=UPI002AB079C9|nr:BRCA1-associated protein isoform X2 [Danaus plexippus]